MIICGGQTEGFGGKIYFTKDIHLGFKAHGAPFLSIDQEGGRVERTENIHGGRGKWEGVPKKFPEDGKRYLSAKFAYECGEEFLREQTRQIAAELKGYGINLNFAPCIDVNTNPDNPVIGERAFSNDPDVVTRAGLLVAKTYLENGIIPCVKHFPGHGDANADSHLTLPVIDKTLEQMQPHLAPFQAAIDAGIEMVMIAHLHCTCFDKDPLPASLSKNAVNYLRGMGFDGVIISDDMVMQGVANIENALERAIRAGVNMFIYRDEPPVDEIEKILEKAKNDRELRENIETSYRKIVTIVDNHF